MDMKNKDKPIYTMTVLQKIDRFYLNKVEWLPEFGDIRCVGYYFDLNDAINSVIHNNQDIYEDMYEYCIVEEVPQGIYKHTPNRYLFKWVEDKYVQIDEPIELNKLTNFGIG